MTAVSLQKSTPQAISLGLLIALIGFPQISETIYTPSLPSIAQDLMASTHAVEATLSIYFLGFALGVLIWGFISDRIGRKTTMLVGLVLYGMSSWKCGETLTVSSLLLWRFFQALGASVGSVITQTILRDVYEGKERSRIFSLISGALAFSPAIGPLLGGYISQYMGWRSNLYLLVSIAALLLLWVTFKLPETKPKSSRPVSAKFLYTLAIEMGRSPLILLHALLIGATNGILFSFYEEAPFVFIDYFGFQPSQYGLIGILLASASLFAAYVSCRLQARKTPEEIIRRGSHIATIGSLIFLIAVTTLTTLQSLIISALGILTLFTGIGLIIPNSLSEALKPYKNSAGSAGSIFGGIYYLLITLATYLMSILHNGTTYALPSFLLFLSLILVFASNKVIKQTFSEGIRDCNSSDFNSAET